MFPGLRGMGNGFGGAGLNEAGMTSGPFGNTGFGGFGGGENSVEEGTGRSPSGPRVGSGGGFSGEAGQPPRTSFGGHGGSGFGDGHFGGVGFGGGHFSGGNFGGDFSRTTSSGGHRWNNMPSRGPPSLGMPGGGAGRVSSGESPEEEALGNLARGAIGSVASDLAGTGLRLLQGSRAGRRLERTSRHHVKMVHCGHHEIPNRGHHRDRFCHPETTWKNVRRLRPDCVCAPGYLRNSWGDCISHAECHHCMNKHHMNMDYNLCESQCPLVCNQPIDTNCPDTCYEECACRPGYIRSRPNGPCISIHQCLPGCPSPKQYFTLCRSSCPATCSNPDPSNCPEYCAGLHHKCSSLEVPILDGIPRTDLFCKPDLAIFAEIYKQRYCLCKAGYIRNAWGQCVTLQECYGCHFTDNADFSPCSSGCPRICGLPTPVNCTKQCGCLGPHQMHTACSPLCPLTCENPELRPVPRPQRNLPGAPPKIHDFQATRFPITCLSDHRRPFTTMCGGHGCVCGGGYVQQQEHPLVCVRRTPNQAHSGQHGPVVASLTQPAYLTAQKLAWTLNLEPAPLSLRAKDVSVIKLRPVTTRSAYLCPQEGVPVTCEAVSR
ncbi:hypothetical protein HPB51_024011 [Rhipicephalus microplus]|uniref:TIL domain-containing protein n=1 Tax=Rhipicephalus microplus TaxID=6941 RepID=A0A9J6ED19_RHIMP|nr:hypothetical protein HPB51_024011 [Rhipicephalus microplus]